MALARFHFAIDTATQRSKRVEPCAGADEVLHAHHVGPAAEGEAARDVEDALAAVGPAAEEGRGQRPFAGCPAPEVNAHFLLADM